MATEKKKLAVLTLSQQFMKGHPKAGLPTHFVEKLKAGIKCHTIRSNYELWAKRAEQINAGKMELSIRVWSGAPYRSQQVEVARLTKLGVQSVSMWYSTKADRPFIDVEGKRMGKYFAMELAANDGLDYNEWINWFFPLRNRDEEQCVIPNFEGVILQFTDMRYTMDQ